MNALEKRMLETATRFVVRPEDGISIEKQAGGYLIRLNRPPGSYTWCVEEMLWDNVLGCDYLPSYLPSVKEAFVLADAVPAGVNG